jgi:hypothetical protein
MRTRPIAPLPLALSALLALGCNAQDPTQPSSLTSITQAMPAAADLTFTSSSTAGATDLPPFDPSSFVRTVDNPLFPLPLGRRLIYKGTEDGEPEMVITEVTRDQKTILGVQVVVVLDRVFMSGELVEKTFDWFAQDRDGNVWYFGEDTKEFENGKVVSTQGSFEAGKHGARAGIIMRAHPKWGQITPQEDAPGVAEDKSRIIGVDVTVTVPYGTFLHCLKTAEFTDLEPDAVEYKLYCPGIGVTRGHDVRGGTAQTKLVRIEDR